MKFVSVIATLSLVVAVMGNPTAENEIGTDPATAGEESDHLYTDGSLLSLLK